MKSFFWLVFGLLALASLSRGEEFDDLDGGVEEIATVRSTERAGLHFHSEEDLVSGKRVRAVEQKQTKTEKEKESNGNVAADAGGGGGEGTCSASKQTCGHDHDHDHDHDHHHHDEDGHHHHHHQDASDLEEQDVFEDDDDEDMWFGNPLELRGLENALPPNCSLTPSPFFRSILPPNLANGEEPTRLSVNFENRADFNVSVYWMNYDGEEVFWFDLNAKMDITYDSSDGHRWRARRKDRNTPAKRTGENETTEGEEGEKEERELPEEQELIAEIAINATEARGGAYWAIIQCLPFEG